MRSSRSLCLGRAATCTCFEHPGSLNQDRVVPYMTLLQSGCTRSHATPSQGNPSPAAPVQVTITGGGAGSRLVLEAALERLGFDMSQWLHPACHQKQSSSRFKRSTRLHISRAGSSECDATIKMLVRSTSVATRRLALSANRTSPAANPSWRGWRISGSIEVATEEAKTSNT